MKIFDFVTQRKWEEVKGGFQEMGHRGMLFADENGRLFFYDHNQQDEPVALSIGLTELA